MPVSFSRPLVAFPSDTRSFPPLDAALPGDLALVDELLRDRGALLDRIDQGHDLARLARAMIVTVAICGAVFGAAAGTFRGGLQVPLSAIKLPLALLLTAAICAPVLTSLNAVLLRRADLRKDLAVVLSCMGLASLVAAALTPLLLIAAGSETMGYRRLVLVTVACAALGGLCGIGFFLRSLRHLGREERGFVGVTVLIVFLLVGAQTVWTLRPFVGMPGSPLVVVHPIQGSFPDAVVRTAWTVAGLRVTDRRPDAPLPAPLAAPTPAPAETPAPLPDPATAEPAAGQPDAVRESAADPARGSAATPPASPAAAPRASEGDGTARRRSRAGGVR